MATQSQSTLQSLRAEFNAQFLERGYVIDALLALIVAKQHGLLLGPPGTSKSTLIVKLAQVFDGQYFVRLLTKTSVPEELFGPYAISKLQQDEFVRKTDGYLPVAHFAFLDEIFKANSAILNSLLTILQEREFDNGGKREAVPLQSAIGASNEMPAGGEELHALFDRFIWRYWLGYLKDENNRRTLLKMQSIHIQSRLSLEELAVMQQEASALEVGDHIIDAILKIRSSLENEGIIVSDRRLREILPFLKAYAYVMGDSSVSEDHLEVLIDCFWLKPQDRKTVQGIVIKLGNPVTAEALELLDQAHEALKKLGEVPPKGDVNRNDWINDAATVNDELDDHINKLAGLIARLSSPPQRAQESLQELQSLKHGLSTKIMDFYK